MIPMYSTDFSPYTLYFVVPADFLLPNFKYITSDSTPLTSCGIRTEESGLVLASPDPVDVGGDGPGGAVPSILAVASLLLGNIVLARIWT